MEVDFDDLIELGDNVDKENILITNDQPVELKRLPDTDKQGASDAESQPKRYCFSEAPVSSVHTTVLHKRIPLNGDYIPITFNDGTRYYISVDSLPDQHEKIIPTFTTSGLAVQAQNLLVSKRVQPASENQFMGIASGEQSSELWTVKHAPSHYLDLISDETTNRTLLRWLKAWDSYVFGYSSTSLTSNSAQLPSNTTTTTTTTTGTSNPSSTIARFVPRADELERIAGDIDPRDGLPRYRILLLTGPPGIGKTTLAHKLAHHAGYQVIEVNASDDRSVSTFRDQLTAVVSTVSTLDRTAANATGDPAGTFKPSCLVLDEIDGAVPGAVELLVAAAQALPQSHSQQQTRRARKRTPLLLRRPVICICNDFYSSAVRPLRAPGVPCLVLKLTSLDLGRLVTRLDAVAREEGLAVDKITLSHLAEMANRDIRACLNAMQFIKSRQRGELDSESVTNLDLSSLASLSGGLKDVRKTLLDAWKSVFTIPSQRVLATQISVANRSSSIRRTTDGDKMLSARVKHIKTTVDAVGEIQSLTMGIFENYLQARMKDASLNVARQASDWFVYNDLLSRRIYSHADYSLMRYPGWLPAWFHLALATQLGLSATSGGPTRGATVGIRWPTAHTEAAASRSRSLAVLEQLLVNQWQLLGSRNKAVAEMDSRSASLHFLSHRDLLLDLLPSAVHLVTLIAASLRPLNAQLYSQQEKQDLANLVDTLLSLGLDWRVQQTEEGGVTTESGEVDYQLEPPIHEVVTLGSDKVTSGSKTVPFTTKQLVARELRFERMRRSDYSLHSKHQPTVGMTTNLTVQKLPTHHMEPTLAALGISKEVRKPKVKKDFFGRVVVGVPKPKVQAEQQSPDENACADQDSANQTVYYRFQEGYSNAVRRPVTMKQLL